MGRARLLALFAAGLWSTVATAADWSVLEHYQQTISRTEFETLLTNVYCPSGALANYLTYGTNSVAVYATPDKTNSPVFTLQFTTKPAAFIPQHLTFKRIALDPGHIGGEWARMEERFFQQGKDRPVQEAELTLMVARLLKTRLEALGAQVFLTKDNFEPVTDKRPEDFHAQAEQEINTSGRFDAFPPLEREAAFGDAVRKRAELIFYRSSEIAARARLLNEKIKPDLTLCLHVNAVEWDECHDLVDDNRLVVFVHGNYLPAELKDDDQKLRLLEKLLQRSHSTELTAAEAIATVLATATKLPAVEYGPNSGSIRTGDSPYVFARNLAANRLVNGPVVFLEPYYQNNRLVYQRIQMGDYEGLRDVNGIPMKSIFREYADAVAEGLSPLIAR